MFLAATFVNHDESTVGVDLCDWTYQKKQFMGAATGKEIKFSTWDFAGQVKLSVASSFVSR